MDQHPHSNDVPISARHLWDALARTPGVELAIAQPTGRIIAGTAETFDPQPAPGAPAILAEVHRERVAAIQRAAESRTPIVFRHLVAGIQMESTLHPIEPTGRQASNVLIITREGISPSTKDAEESAYVDLGPLSVLTPRELEVLALLGQGMQIAEIARTLYRSPKTVEKHRAAISRKLGVLSRAELARMVQRAELEVQDARRVRVDSPKRAHKPLPN